MSKQSFDILFPYGPMKTKTNQKKKQKTRGPGALWSAWTEDPVHKNVLKGFK